MKINITHVLEFNTVLLQPKYIYVRWKTVGKHCISQESVALFLPKHTDFHTRCGYSYLCPKSRRQLTFNVPSGLYGVFEDLLRPNLLMVSA